MTHHLLGLYDSPYVRRVAIALQLLGLRFEHNPLSVFRTFDQFQSINPVVKAPTLVCDDGGVLMDSTLILEYAQALAGRRLLDQRRRHRVPRCGGETLGVGPPAGRTGPVTQGLSARS